MGAAANAMSMSLRIPVRKPQTSDITPGTEPIHSFLGLKGESVTVGVCLNTLKLVEYWNVVGSHTSCIASPIGIDNADCLNRSV